MLNVTRVHDDGTRLQNAGMALQGIKTDSDPPGKFTSTCSIYSSISVNEVPAFFWAETAILYNYYRKPCVS